MFERLNTPEEAFNYKLGATLKMERTVLEKILDDSERGSERDAQAAVPPPRRRDPPADPQPRAGLRGVRLGGRRLAVSGDRGHPQGGQDQRQEDRRRDRRLDHPLRRPRDRASRDRRL